MSSEPDPTETSSSSGDPEQEPPGEPVDGHPLWRCTDPRRGRYERIDGVVADVGCISTFGRLRYRCEVYYPDRDGWTHFDATGLDAALDAINERHPCTEEPVSDHSPYEENPDDSTQEKPGTRLLTHPLWRRIEKGRLERDDGTILDVNLCDIRGHTQWDCQLLLPGQVDWQHFYATNIATALQAVDRAHPFSKEAPVSSPSDPSKTSPSPGGSQDTRESRAPLISPNIALAVLAGVGVAELWRASGSRGKRLMIEIGHVLVTGSAPSPEQGERIAELLQERTPPPAAEQ